MNWTLEVVIVPVSGRQRQVPTLCFACGPPDSCRAEVCGGNGVAQFGQSEGLCSDSAGAVENPGWYREPDEVIERAGLLCDRMLPVLVQEVVAVGELGVESAHGAALFDVNHLHRTAK